MRAAWIAGAALILSSCGAQVGGTGSGSHGGDQPIHPSPGPAPGPAPIDETTPLVCRSGNVMDAVSVCTTGDGSHYNSQLAETIRLWASSAPNGSGVFTDAYFESLSFEKRFGLTSNAKDCLKRFLCKEMENENE